VEDILIDAKPNVTKPSEKITFVETIYHQSGLDNPFAVDHRCIRVLSGRGEQPYYRKTKVGQDWAKLDFGWLAEKVDNVGLVLVRNLEGVFSSVMPTEEMRATAKGKILELGVGNTDARSTHLLILPNEQFRFTPDVGCNYFIRSRSGISEFILHAFAK
jgi:hypothetical protein